MPYFLGVTSTHKLINFAPKLALKCKLPLVSDSWFHVDVILPSFCVG